MKIFKIWADCKFAFFVSGMRNICPVLKKHTVLKLKSNFEHATEKDLPDISPWFCDALIISKRAIKILSKKLDGLLLPTRIDGINTGHKVFVPKCFNPCESSAVLGGLDSRYDFNSAQISNYPTFLSTADGVNWIFVNEEFLTLTHENGLVGYRATEVWSETGGGLGYDLESGRYRPISELSKRVSTQTIVGNEIRVVVSYD